MLLLTLAPLEVAGIRFIPETLYHVTVSQSRKVVQSEEQPWDKSNSKASLYLWTLRKTIAKEECVDCTCLGKLFSTDVRYCHCKS